MCTKARGGSKRGRALSRRRLGQHAGQCMALSQRERPMSRCRMVAKCSVMMGGQLVSRRRLFGCSGPKSGSAGSSWRPQNTQISAAPQTMAPVLQDKPRHSTQISPSSARSYSYFGRLYTLLRRMYEPKAQDLSNTGGRTPLNNHIVKRGYAAVVAGIAPANR